MNQSHWQAMIVDVVTLLVVGALAYLKVLAPEIASGLLGAVVMKYAALAKPPEPPAGGRGIGAGSALAGSAIGMALTLPFRAARVMA